jgi:hypothetical protein
VFDYIITTPGYPRHVEGRQAVAELYRPMATRSSLTAATISPSTTTPTPASSCSSTPHKVASLRPELPTPTGTSQCSQSRIARSLAGATTSTLWPSSTLSGGPHPKDVVAHTGPPSRPAHFTSAIQEMVALSDFLSRTIVGPGLART